MRKLTLFILIAFFSIQAFSQKKSLPDSLLSKTILTVDTLKVSVEEFLWFNNKYNSYADSSLRLELDEYSKLFVEYKMKVLEAESKLLDTSRSFIQEFQSYLKPTVRNYIYDKSIDDAYVNTVYERLNYDYEVSHIFIRSDKFSNPADTLKAYRKAQKIKADLLNGKDFASYAKEVSDDSFSKDSGGYVGYITALLMPMEYENAVYSSYIGELIGPVSSRHGYYIIKVTDIRKSYGQRRASMIAIYPYDSQKEADWKTAKIKIDSIYNELQNGKDFKRMAVVHNTNPTLLKKESDIGWFDNSMTYPSSMKEPIFELQNIGDYTKPIKQYYGYIIAQLTGIDSLPKFSETEKVVRRALQYDETRKNLKEKAYYAKLKKETNFKVNEQNFQEFINLIDNSILVGKWSIPHFKENKLLFSQAEYSYYYEDFAKFLLNNQKHKRIADKEILIRYRFSEYVDKMMEYYAFKKLPSVNKNFAMLMQEYHDGMIMYELLQKEVYQKAANDSVGLDGYYKANLDKYMKPNGVAVSYFYCKNSDVSAKAKKLIAKKTKKGYTDQMIVASLNKKAMDNVILDSVIYYKGDSKSIDSLDWVQNKIYEQDNNKLIYISRVIPAAPMPFEQCKSKVIANYQFWLEDLWKEHLREKYTYSINDDVFYTVKKYIK